MPTLSRHWLVSRYCMKAFSPVSSGQVVGFFVSGGGHRGYLLFLIAHWWNRCACSTLPFYRFPLCIEESRTKNRSCASFTLFPGKA